MIKFEANLEIEVTIEIHDHEAAHAFYIEGDWKDSFFKFDDLSEMVKHIAAVISSSCETFCREKNEFYFELDGFGRFYSMDDRSGYLLENSAEHGGAIFVDPSELECTWVSELEDN